MSFEHSLKIGDVLKNDQLTETFRCSPQGGMRRSRSTNTLLIISDHTKSIYEDRWLGDTFHYTGMGLKGDQRIDKAQNRTLAEARTNGIELYLFEVFEKGQYVFQGQIELEDDPYQEKQPDLDGTLRKVWVFPLRPLGGKSYVSMPEGMVLKKQQLKEREARHLTDLELERRARYSRKGVGKRQITSTAFERNVYVSELAKRRAGGFCQLCNNPAPFDDKRKQPYLESHHVVWLSAGGPDVIENTVALCPNCHRKMHVLNKITDVKRLKEFAQTFSPE